jgi:putative sigma-54 modulation protein
MRLDKNEKNENKIIEIKMNVPGKTLFAKQQSDSFEAAADEAVEALRRQIKKFKEKVVLERQ